MLLDLMRDRDGVLSPVRVLTAGVLVAVVLVWGGCSAWHAVTRHHALEGKVIAKDYNPAHVIFIPITHCSGNPPVCTTTYIPQFIPENWNVRVIDDTDTEDWHQVEPYVYDGCDLGDYWPGEDLPCRETKDF